ncbi:Bacterial regulatory proteins, tetR family [Eubacteriaceae bacterium CHKCI004]|nr:Bacterial regulatory proteins, tetR family [Eubacteriaceae bacterium CHKCI004]
MTHAENSLRTKTKLADSLKKLMMHKSFSKITVSEIIRDCNVNRKTFYYHFEDIYALLKWMFAQDAINIVKEYDLPSEYREALSFVMDYISDNSYILNCIFDSVGLEEMKRSLYPDIHDIIRICIDSKEEELGLHIKEDFKNFICNLYTEGFSGTLLKQIKEPDNVSKEEAISYYSLILNVSLPSVLQSAPKKEDLQPEIQ